ncbi:MAG: 16S rRNA (adenine(1518)-N(6)/adenine(1519)-N(6))-dimethyltransferase RsmA [Halieaceae bacterium]|nr:16S rRNA (adenine(1518)-N(6)/adenine(1519)-N(6))-dimethyltransferase RsmA [Halieaceae bacterium]
MTKPTKPHRARKRFGQNFLHDAGVIDNIIRAIHPLETEHLVEIGPGQGALTEFLSGSGCRLDVIELDRDLVPGLLRAYGNSPQFALHGADALGFDYSSLADDDRPLRIVGNLPYNISTPLIFKLLESAAVIRDMHFMLQLEVVNRLAASPGNKNWGRLGIMAQYRCRIEALFEVPPSAFSPAPKVQSAIVRLEPFSESPWPDCNEATLRQVVRASFAQRRKTLRNNLKGILDAAALEKAGIDPGARAETLGLLQFIEIANIVDG